MMKIWSFLSTWYSSVFLQAWLSSLQYFSVSCFFHNIWNIHIIWNFRNFLFPSSRRWILLKFSLKCCWLFSYWPLNFWFHCKISIMFKPVMCIKTQTSFEILVAKSTLDTLMPFQECLLTSSSHVFWRVYEFFTKFYASSFVEGCKVSINCYDKQLIFDLNRKFLPCRQ